jgi:hypothetical protein
MTSGSGYTGWMVKSGRFSKGTTGLFIVWNSVLMVKCMPVEVVSELLSLRGDASEPKSRLCVFSEDGECLGIMAD